MANPASDTWSQSESEGGASWIDRVKLQPPQPATADNLARSATLSWPVAPDAFIEEVVQILTLMGSSSSKHPRPAAADASPHPVLHLRTGNVEVLSLPRLAQLCDAITAASHHRCLDVVTKSHFNVAASMIAKRTTNHCCLSGVCGGDRCPFAFVPLDACHVFLKHGMCSARHCRYTHYVLALRLETMTMYVFRAALSVGQAAAISPSVVLLTKSARLELLAVVREAVAARSRATACAFQSHARDAARFANARAVNQARNASVADVIAEERRRIVLEDELEALIGGRDEREPPSSRHRSESHTSSGLLL